MSCDDNWVQRSRQPVFINGSGGRWELRAWQLCLLGLLAVLGEGSWVGAAGQGARAPARVGSSAAIILLVRVELAGLTKRLGRGRA